MSTRVEMPSQEGLTGGCHCRAVRFRIHPVPGHRTVQTCNCSMCARTGFIHLIVPGSAFHLINGKDKLTEYRFNTGTARHMFCRQCGVKSFYVPRSNPDGFSINVRCLDAPLSPQWRFEAFDGAHWEQAGHTLAELSKDGEK